ncbi:MAG TPA: restriction endonuclease subunit S [Ignavibacteria bacterium]|nr:restriction endonuclease subunit S [Ignavibacteria bacterium]
MGNNKIKNIKKFYNSEIPVDWEISSFGENFEFLKTFAFSRKNLTSEKTELELQNIHYGDIHSKFENEILDVEKFQLPYVKKGLIKKEKIEEENFPKLKDGDLIITDVSEDYVGLCESIEIENVGDKLIVGGLHTYICRVKTEKIAKRIKPYLLKHPQIVRQIRRLANGISVYGLSKKELSKILLALPPLKEQNAIANILELFDKLIELYSKLLEQKQFRKKWLMQNLLSGKIRLKGFKDKWRSYNLNSLGDTYSGLNGKNKEDFGTGFPYIPYLNIYNNFVVDVKNLSYVNVKENELQNCVQFGDIFFTISSETPDEVGISSVLLENNLSTLYLNSFCFGYRLKNFDILNPHFASYIFRANGFRFKLRKLSQGATRYNLSKKSFLKLDIVLPSKMEQEKILQFLHLQENQLYFYNSKLNILKNFKKGYMQKLLSGKKRFKNFL